MKTRKLAVSIFEKLPEEEKQKTSVQHLIRQIHVYKNSGYTEDHLKEILPVDNVENLDEKIGITVYSIPNNYETRDFSDNSQKLS